MALHHSAKASGATGIFSATIDQLLFAVRGEQYLPKLSEGMMNFRWGCTAVFGVIGALALMVAIFASGSAPQQAAAAAIAIGLAVIPYVVARAMDSLDVRINSEMLGCLPHATAHYAPGDTVRLESSADGSQIRVIGPSGEVGIIAKYDQGRAQLICTANANPIGKVQWFLSRKDTITIRLSLPVN